MPRLMWKVQSGSLRAAAMRLRRAEAGQRVCACRAVRADLHTKGFEWALLYSQPTNQPMHRYKVPPACCNMTHDPKTNK